MSKINTSDAIGRLEEFYRSLPDGHVDKIGIRRAIEHLSYVPPQGLADLPAELKVDLLKAMGFTRHGDTHQPDCAYVISEGGYICQCIEPAGVWAQPADVDAFFNESYEERLARSQARSARINR